MPSATAFEEHLRRFRSQPDRIRSLVLTGLETSKGAAAKADLRARIKREVDILFVEERSLLQLLEMDLGEACVWLSNANVLAVVFMGREAVVLIDGGEQIYTPPAPNFAIASGRYVRGFLSAVAENKSPLDCALEGSRRAAAVDEEMRRLGH